MSQTQKERLYKVLLGPVVSEKAAAASESANQVVFKVLITATKAEIKAAIEKLFEVKVENVRTLNRNGKKRSYRNKVYKTSSWKKAVVTLKEGSTIDFGY